jgi:hypothetical protein
MNRDSQRPTRPPSGGQAQGEDDGEERPTLVPQFDLAEFARENMLKRETPSGPVSGVPAGGAPVLSSASMDLGELFRAGDHEATLALSEALLQQDPEDPEARKYAELSRLELAVTYLTAFGGNGSAIPRVKSAEAAKGLGGLFGEVLAAVDGVQSVDSLVLTSRQDRLAVLSTLYELLQRGAIELA